MILSDLEGSITSKVIRETIRKQFNYDFPLSELTPIKAKAVYEELCKQINEYRYSEQYFLGETDSRYLGMLFASHIISEYLKESAILVEKDRPTRQVSPQAYHHGIKKGVAHGLDTTTKFVPHVAGSALGAFVGGLKGQSLSSDAGRVKITNLEQELSMIDPKNPASAKKFFDNQMSQHFNEYKDPRNRKAISDFMNGIYRDALAGKTQTPQSIEAALARIPGDPFKTVTNPEEKKKLVTYFMNIYKGGLAAKNPAKPATRTAVAQGAPATQVMADVASALSNLGYPRKNAIDAVKQAIAKDKNLNGNFDGLLRASQALVRK